MLLLWVSYRSMTSRFPPFAFVELVSRVASQYNKKNITCWLEDMNFMFSWQEQYLTRSLRSLVRYCSCHSNIKFISSRHRVISSIHLISPTHPPNPCTQFIHSNLPDSACVWITSSPSPKKDLTSVPGISWTAFSFCEANSKIIEFTTSAATTVDLSYKINIHNFALKICCTLPEIQQTLYCGILIADVILDCWQSVFSEHSAGIMRQVA